LENPYLVEDEFGINPISELASGVRVFACPKESCPDTTSDLEDGGTEFPVEEFFRVNIIHDATTPPSSKRI
jgi:hypothetical protein